MRFLQLFAVISCLVGASACVSEQVSDDPGQSGDGKADGTQTTHDDAWVASVRKALDVHKDRPVDAPDIKISFLSEDPTSWPTWVRTLRDVMVKDRNLGVSIPMQLRVAGATAYLLSGTRAGCGLFSCTGTTQVYVLDVDQKIAASGIYTFTYDRDTTQVENEDQAITWDDPPQLPGSH